MTTRTDSRDRTLLDAARQACLRAAADAYEDAGIRGLCDDGRWECALGAIRALDLEKVMRSTLQAAPASSVETARLTDDGR